jgi:thioredoxin 1
MMQPVLDNLRINYPDKLNVVFVHVREEKILAARYDIRSIPVQAFFDATGNEVFRNVGFMDKKRIVEVLSRLGVS